MPKHVLFTLHDAEALPATLKRMEGLFDLNPF